MERKLLFFDIDGTLIPDINSPVPESTKEALRLAQEAGHYIFINTGRPKSILPKELFELGFDGYLCGCGSHVIIKDQIVIEKNFDADRAGELFLRARQMRVPIILEGNRYCYLDRKGATSDYFERTNDLLMKEFPGSIVDVDDQEEINIHKFCITADSREKMTEFLLPFSDYFEPIDRGNDFYEIVPIGFSKASAIDTVLSHLGQTLEDCYAFGDSTNDLSMLLHVPNSIAMGNSDEAVLKVASYVTTPVWRDGIYVAMKHFGLI